MRFSAVLSCCSLFDKFPVSILNSILLKFGLFCCECNGVIIKKTLYLFVSIFYRCTMNFQNFYSCTANNENIFHSKLCFYTLNSCFTGLTKSPPLLQTFPLIYETGKSFNIYLKTNSKEHFSFEFMTLLFVDDI